MNNTYPLIAMLLLAVFSMQITPAFADGVQGKEDDVLTEHPTEIQEASKLEGFLTAPAQLFAPKESREKFEKLSGTDYHMKTSSAKESRRYMETPVLVMIIGGGVWLLGIILLVVGVASVSVTGFGIAGIGWLLAVLGGLTATAGFIWWLVTR